MNDKAWKILIAAGATTVLGFFVVMILLAIAVR